MKSNSVSNLSSPDVVILHCLERGKTVPSVSPFVLKLETYLRMTQIPYKIDTKKPFGPAGKTPWITLNGMDMTDSQLIMEFLNKKFDKNTWPEGTTAEQKSLARTIRIMVEEHMFWGMARWRFFEGISAIPSLINISSLKFSLMKLFIPSRLRKTLEAQGLGRLPPETITAITTQDLRDLSLLLGDKPFILGGQACEVDCALFGFLSQCLWAMPGSPFHNLIENELTNLKEFCYRMKERLWEDWDECLFKSK